MDEKPHKRRVRYKGTHPRRYEEKYKEHNPEKYKDTIEKVIARQHPCRYAPLYHGPGNP